MMQGKASFQYMLKDSPVLLMPHARKTPSQVSMGFLDVVEILLTGIFDDSRKYRLSRGQAHNLQQLKSSLVAGLNTRRALLLCAGTMSV